MDIKLLTEKVMDLAEELHCRSSFCFTNTYDKGEELFYIEITLINNGDNKVLVKYTDSAENIPYLNDKLLAFFDLKNKEA